MQDSPNTHLIIIFLLLVAIINLFILDLKVMSPVSNIQIADISTKIAPSPTSSTQLITNNPQLNTLSCPLDCLSIISNATKSAAKTTSENKFTTTAFSQTRETYIPMGTGTTNKTVWDDVKTSDTTIDPSYYGSIKEVYFIASLKNPTQNGQVDAQLYNVTDKHPVWNSQVTLNGPLSDTLTSARITLDGGNKLYRVQLKSSLGYEASLENAKVKIISN